MGVSDPRASVGWAKWYGEVLHGRQLAAMNAALRDRVEVLIPELLGLIDAVLYERNCQAFARAHRLRRLIDDFLGGAPR